MAASERAQVQLVLKLFGLPVRVVPRHAKSGVFDCRPGGQLCEVGGGSPVNLRYRVGVVPEGGGSTAAMAKACSSIAKVDRAASNWLAV